jgi:vitamin B12 transporter
LEKTPKTFSIRPEEPLSLWRRLERLLARKSTVSLAKEGRGGSVRGTLFALIALFTVALLSALRAAHAADEQEEKPLGTVVVTATRTEQAVEQATTSVSVITADDIQSRRADAVTNVLRDVPGLTVLQQGSPGTSASVLIRGAEADQTLALIDGVRVNSPTLGQFNFGPLTTDNFSRIEVLRGSGGTLYGSEAVGGVINLITKRGEGPPHVSFLGEGGNGATQRYLMQLGGAQGPVGVSGSVGYESDAGFEPINDDYTNLTGSLRADADLVEHGTLRGIFRYLDADSGLFNNLNFLFPLQPDPNARFSDEVYLAKGEWEHQPFDSLSYRVAGSIVHETQVFTDPDAGAFSTRWSEIPTQINSGEAQANYYFETIGITTGGFEYREEEARPKSRDVTDSGGTTESGYSASRRIVAGYLQQQVLLLDERLIGVGGFRVDSDEGFGRAVSPSWSAGYLQDWDGTKRWATRFKGGYSEGFKAPTFNELFFPNFGNPDLDAETSSEWDGGVVQHVWQTWLSADATYFSRRVKGQIQGVFDPTTGVFEAENVGRVDVAGVETGVNVGPVAGFSLRGSYTYLGWTVVGGNGTLLRRPHNAMATVARYQRASILQEGDDIDCTVNVSFLGERQDFDPAAFARMPDNPMPIVDNPSYTVSGFAVTYGFVPPIPWVQHIAVFTRVNNMFDRSYQETFGFQSPPINFVMGAKVSL